jgi:hypothetical protein
MTKKLQVRVVAENLLLQESPRTDSAAGIPDDYVSRAASAQCAWKGMA